MKMLEAAYSDEVNYPILSDVASNLTTIKYVTWNDEECSKLFKQFTNKLFTNAAETLGWTPKEGEGLFAKYLKIRFFEFLIDF